MCQSLKTDHLSLRYIKANALQFCIGGIVMGILVFEEENMAALLT
jgi:hypothetical protein